MIRVVELKRTGTGRGEIIRREEFKSWKAAYNYFENDGLYNRNCPDTSITHISRTNGVIQHWGMGRDGETCRCNEINDREFNTIVET